MTRSKTAFSNAYLILLTFALFSSCRYHRCQFELPLYPERHPSGGGQQQQQQGLGGQTYVSTTPVTVTAFSRWEEIASRVKASERPVVLNRASSTNTTNPFGSTFCYGYQDVIFEVMPKGYLASVTLYFLDNGRRPLNARGQGPQGLQGLGRVGQGLDDLDLGVLGQVA